MREEDADDSSIFNRAYPNTFPFAVGARARWGRMNEEGGRGDDYVRPCMSRRAVESGVEGCKWRVGGG